VVFMSAMFNTSLWLVKLAFLVFFKRIGVDAIKGLKMYWWVVVGLTVATYPLLYAFSQDKCFWNEGVIACSAKRDVRKWTMVGIKVNCGLDVVTDFLST
jgi:hypothetical protein